MTVSKLTHRRIHRFPNLSLTLRGVIFEDTCCHESILPVVLANCFKELLNPFTAKFSRKQISTKFTHFSLWNFEKQIAPCVSTGRELSFEWSDHRILSTESKVRVTLQNTIKHSGIERVNLKLLSITDRKDQIAAPIRFPNSSSTYLLACVADVIQPRFVTTATQRRDPCSGPSTDSMNYRKWVSNFVYPDWQINNGFFNRPIMVRTQILVHSWGGPEQRFRRCFEERLN